MDSGADLLNGEQSLKYSMAAHLTKLFIKMLGVLLDMQLFANKMV